IVFLHTPSEPIYTLYPYTTLFRSNYVCKMSNFEKGNWAEIWDALYWRFISKHKKQLEKNPRMILILNQLKKMDRKKLNQHLKIRSEEHTSELQSRENLVCRLLREK